MRRTSPEQLRVLRPCNCVYKSSLEVLLPSLPIIVFLAILKMKFVVAMLLALGASKVLCFADGQASTDGKPVYQ